MKQNKIKPDTILKNFWRDNHHFADLFNAALFDGEQVLNPADLSEADTDVSSFLKFNGHAETVQKVLDVVKKTAYGIDLLLFTAASKYAIRLVELARKRLIGYLDVTGIRNLHYISKT